MEAITNSPITEVKNLFHQIEEIKNFAVGIFKQAVDKSGFDEWHQFGDVADVHICLSDEADADGIYRMEIFAYALVEDEDGKFSTDTSKGIQIFINADFGEKIMFYENFSNILFKANGTL